VRFSREGDVALTDYRDNHIFGLGHQKMVLGYATSTAAEKKVMYSDGVLAITREWSRLGLADNAITR
jgi:hypothetical protein